MAQEADRKRALVVAAHPDDAEFGCSGTIALWARDGWEVHYLICTDGSKGSDDPHLNKEQLIDMRRQEQRAAAAILGVADVSFLDYEDGTLAYNPNLLRDVVRHIRRLRPYSVFTHHPEQIHRDAAFINHPDHRCVGAVTIDAVYPVARNRPSFPELLDEGLQPFKVQELYLWGASGPNFTVDITAVEEVKVQALRAHRSQFLEMEERIPDLLNRWRDESGRMIEKFFRIVLPF